MPPPGAPRPDAATYAAVDRASRERARCGRGCEPQPGPRAGAPLEPHRIHQRHSRPARPRDRRPRVCCSADEADQEGFDNVASVLSVSPALLENYLSAARMISRLAVGDTSRSARWSTSSRVRARLVQDERMSDDLPFGSRGGTAVAYQFPRRRRVHHQGPAQAPALRLHRRHGRAASARRPPRRRAAEAVHGRRRRQGDDHAGELRRQHARAIPSGRATCTPRTRGSKCACR